MDPIICIMILLFGISGGVNAQDFYVVAPTSLRLSSDETIGISIDGFPGGSARVYLQDHPGKSRNISEKVVVVNPGEPELVKIRLDPQNFPDGFFTSPDSPKLVSLNADFQNIHKEILVPISGQSGYVFIQTDKPIYTPDEKVYIRIIPLDEDSLPSYGPLRLQIRNPDGNIVEQNDLGASHRDKAFVSIIYNFPSYSGLGEWSAGVYYGHNLTQNSTVRFQLQEYVLPFFTVELETPDVILPSDETATFKVTAKYSTGKLVKGFVTFRIGPKINGEVIFTTHSPQELVDGSFTLTVPTLTLVESFLPSSEIEGSRLHVEATVVDAATGKEEKVEDSKCIFANNPFDVSFRRCLRDFKPGFTSVVEADISYKNGQPASGVPIRIEARTNRNKALAIVRDVAETDESGAVSFGIQPEKKDKSITVTLYTTTQKYGRMKIGTVQLRASENNTYIALARDRSLSWKPGNLFTRRIYMKPGGIKDVYFLVLVRGKILTMKKLPEGDYLDPKVKFDITYEMVPSFRVLIFAHHGGRLLADSLKIEVENLCHPNAKVSIQTLFEIKEPGYPWKVIIEGTEGTSVGLFGVDEAVYSLSRKDLLIKTKLYNRLASHDIGCGPGGGGSVGEILGNAGVTMATNNFSPSPSYSCLERKRRKRQVLYDISGIVANYTRFERLCCDLGIEYDPSHRSCEDRKTIVHSYLTEEEYFNCSEVFLDCCLHRLEHIEFKRRMQDERNIGTNFVAVELDEGTRGSIEPEFIDLDDLEKIEAIQRIRKDFKQTWFNEDVLIGPNKREEMNFTLPGSITTWVIQGVSVSPSHGVCIAEPKKLESTKKIFLHLNIPYSVVRNEQIEIQATIFNYVTMPIAATVYMYGAKGLCSGTQPDKKSETKQIIIEALSSSTVSFSVIPLKAEVIPIKVVVLSALGSDIVVKKLRVIPEGVTREVTIPIKLDPTNQQGRKQLRIENLPYLIDEIDLTLNRQVTYVNLTIPEDFIPGTESCIITAIGDVYGPAVETTINNPDGLMKMPGGCGEQNMVNLAPTLYTVRYLKATGKLTAESEKKGYHYMRKGYSRQITVHMKKDGSYAAFPRRATSTWLTAFVIKVFCQASELIDIDETVIRKGIRWLINNQQEDHSFTENYPLYAVDLMGGLQGRSPMTAFVLIALQECKCDENNLSVVKERALKFVENHLEEANSPLSAAIIAYALALSDSPLKREANDKLMSMSTFNGDRNWLHWPTNNSAQDIQTAGYALLTQVLFNDMERSMSIVNWLNTQQLQSGTYKSTQDTVIALQAMSEYAIRARMPSLNLSTDITSSNDQDFHRTLSLTDKNALILQIVNVNKVGGIHTMITKGSGMGSLSVKLRYNVRVPPEDCKFDLNINVTNTKEEDIVECLKKELSTNVRTEVKSKDQKLRYNIRVCVRYLGEKDAGMSIVDVGMLTGFRPVKEDLEKIQNDRHQLIKKFEETDRSVVFYLEKIFYYCNYCFSFHVVREFMVGNTQRTPVKVYDYYNPDEKCTKFYKPEGPLLQPICTNGICQCANGPVSPPSSGCPRNKPFIEDLTLLEGTEALSKIRYSFCEDYDYVWIAKLDKSIRKEGGFLHLSFLVKEVLRRGIESRIDVEGETRILLAQDNCILENLHKGVEYLILGKDGQKNFDEDGVPWYRYLLDQSTVIYKWNYFQEAADSEMDVHIDSVIRDLREEGCNYSRQQYEFK